MPQRRRPKRGSRGFSPRKRARSETPRVTSWPDGGQEPKIQGFAGYKAGMTHAFVVDYRSTSTTSKQEIQIPVTIIEVPPMRVAAIRGYKQSHYGLKAAGEIWAKKQERELRKVMNVPKKHDDKKAWKALKDGDIEDVRVIMHTQPRLITGVPKRAPEVMEIRVGGGTIEQRLDYAKSLLGKEIGISEFTREGSMIDVIGVTKGKGFQGHIQRWGVKLLHHKNSKHRRMIGTAGPWRPHFTMPTVPQAGQMGYHQRTEFNKRVLKMFTTHKKDESKGKKGEKKDAKDKASAKAKESEHEVSDEVTPRGGFLHYGVIQSDYIILHGTTPGPSKRLIRLRHPLRFAGTDVEKPDLTYISLASKQGR